MTNRLWGPYQFLPNCRLWLAEDRICGPAEASELHEELATARLTSQDLIRFNRYRPLKKKRQFLSSRLALRTVLDHEFGNCSDEFSVRTTESGQPVLEHQGGGPMASISLSHTGNMTAIALADKHLSVGIDIEAIQPLNARTFNLTFINQYEHDWLAENALSDKPAALLAVWTVKEALWKALGGPQDIPLAEIVVSYRNAILSSDLPSSKGHKEPVASHFFGQCYVFPADLTNYSSIDGPDSHVTGFVGSVVVVNPDCPTGRNGRIAPQAG